MTFELTPTFLRPIQRLLLDDVISEIMGNPDSSWCVSATVRGITKELCRSTPQSDGASHRVNCDTPPLLGNCRETCGSHGERSWHLIHNVFRGSVRKPANYVSTDTLGGLGEMALLDEKNLMAERTRRARFRVHHVGTKLNEAELHGLEALAAKENKTHAELIRGLILREIEREKLGPCPSVELEEITACRLLLINVLGPLAMGQKMSPELLSATIEEITKQEVRLARGRLKDYQARR
jgi:hypothetical protein